jgi:hypothetical protein
MNYMILIYQDAAQAAMPLDMASPITAPWIAYSKALRDAGVMVGGNRLAPHPSATTVRVRDGKRQVQDGPYADTKEQLAGYYMIDVPDLDTALDWAAKCPGAANGIVEVRPLVV